MLVKDKNIVKCECCNRRHIKTLMKNKKPQYDSDHKYIVGYFYDCVCGSSLFMFNEKTEALFLEPR